MSELQSQLANALHDLAGQYETEMKVLVGQVLSLSGHVRSLNDRLELQTAQIVNLTDAYVKLTTKWSERFEE